MVLTREENEELTRVGADTPGGGFLRRYWHPICRRPGVDTGTAKKSASAYSARILWYSETPAGSMG